MKKTIIFLLLAMLISPAYADGVHLPLSEIDIELEAARESIKKQYVEEFCNRPQPKEPVGEEVSIYYERDENGSCVARATQRKVK